MELSIPAMQVPRKVKQAEAVEDEDTDDDRTYRPGKKIIERPLSAPLEPAAGTARRRKPAAKPAPKAAKRLPARAEPIRIAEDMYTDEVTPPPSP